MKKKIMVIVLLSIYVLGCTNPYRKNYNGGVEYLRQQRFIKAEQSFKLCINEKPSDPDGFYGLAKTYYQWGKYKQALEPLSNSLALAPKNWRSLWLIGLTYYQLGRLEEAAASLLECYDLHPTIDCAFNIGIVLRELGYYERAREFTNIYLKSNPNSVHALENLALCYQAEGNNKRAKDLWQRALVYETDDQRKNIIIENYLDLTRPPVEIEKVVDVDTPPTNTRSIRPYGMAVIIGIENYKHTFPAMYKRRDALVFYDYCKKVLGIDNDRRIILSLDDEATLAEIEHIFKINTPEQRNWIEQQLITMGSPQEAEIFIYLGGHGFSDIHTRSSYFIPYDVRPGDAGNGIYLQKLFRRLGKLEAKGIYIFIESCFSGESGYKHDSVRHPLLADANIVIPIIKGTVFKNNMVVFSATSGINPSYNSEEFKHGIFTYYLLNGLRGAADDNKDAAITVKELFQYIEKSVSKKALEKYLDQIPEINLPIGEIRNEIENRVLVQF